MCVVNKVDSAPQEGVDAVRASIRELNPRAEVVMRSPFAVEGDAEAIRGKRVLAIEDGPTLTHGDMRTAPPCWPRGSSAPASLVDPRPFVVGSIKETFEKYPHVADLLPAMGYGDQQIDELRETIERLGRRPRADRTPIDLRGSSTSTSRPCGSRTAWRRSASRRSSRS